eukprot:CAMPEP_0174280240 /NCGR_PEP_ID=MMETSP0809-20121228/508_1 /TAXON_ID=73025 ORGANISM="Eutreptiella gymnastica-like, Strain CCMP1594" /NCGR_SAMPLE_ID=MMETSP0809 /ASSEMBLY_ACC=CAM_ASM_000658 /LENGTH=86 /DNA_ID=CAMNT_0015372997 /DNA_START=92 /DNA_END=353 /DNA_ORIENTATION=+
MDQDFMGYLKRHKMVLYTTEIDKDDEDNQMFYVIFAQAWALPQQFARELVLATRHFSVVSSMGLEGMVFEHMVANEQCFNRYATGL